MLKEASIHTLFFRKGRVERNARRGYRRALRNLTNTLATYQSLTRLFAVGMILTVLPSVGVPARAQGFPSTEDRLVLTRGVRPLAQVEQRVTIVPGESLADRAAREAAEAKRRTAVAPRPVAATVRTAAYPPCPASFRPFYQEVGPRFGVPWQVLEAIHQVESGKSCHTSRRSFAGAVGPMQFLPSTWRRYGWDCDGDGVKDITNAFDAICGAAHHIGTGLTGLPLARAIYNYNRSWSYVNKVMTIARELGL